MADSTSAKFFIKARGKVKCHVITANYLFSFTGSNGAELLAKTRKELRQKTFVMADH